MGSAMQRTVRVTINVEVLRSNLSKEENREITEAETLQWLKDAGFHAAPSGWIVTEGNLGQLDPAEVIEVEVIGE